MNLYVKVRNVAVHQKSKNGSIAGRGREGPIDPTCTIPTDDHIQLLNCNDRCNKEIDLRSFKQENILSANIKRCKT